MSTLSQSKLDWLPPLKECLDFSKYSEYEDELYDIFKNDFMINKISFLNKRLEVTKNPMVNGKADGFYHYICGYNRKSPDFDRCARIPWARKIIEAFNDNIEGKNGIKAYKKGDGYYLLLPEEKFVLIIRDRKDYMLLITGFCVTGKRYLQSMLNDYEQGKID